MTRSDTRENGIITPEGLWHSAAVKPLTPLRAGLFLDRDGVLVREANYLHRRSDVGLEAGAAALVRWANRRQIPVAIVTNQSGIDRHMFGWPEFETVQDEVVRQLARQGARLDFAIACPFHPDFTPSWDERHAHWRKPGPGMVHFAAKALGVDPTLSWLVGDSASDIASAKAAGLAGAVHVLTGHGAQFRATVLSMNGPRFTVLPAEGLEETLSLLPERFAAGQ